MADATEVVILEPFFLTTADAAALEADVEPRAFFQPNFVLRSAFGDGSGITIPIAADGDLWRVLFAPPNSMPHTVFYPISLTCQFVSLGAATFAATFWETAAGYTINAPNTQVGPRDWVWNSFDLDARRLLFNGTSVESYQSGNPPFNGFPPPPVLATGTPPVSSIDNAIAGFMFTVQTFNETARAAMRLHVDARFLAFPRSVTRNAGWYAPRLTFKLN